MSVEVRKSPLDEKEYKCLSLANGLKVLLISEYNLAHQDDDESDSGSESGDSESGDSESGDSESGDSESGDSKSEDSKSGDSESSNHENGISPLLSKGVPSGSGCTSRKRRKTESGSSDDDQFKEKGTSCRKENKQLFNAACGLCVRVGSFHDPKELPGLAHLLEHMLFMGSEKYPGENEFDAFVSSHGGGSNACTGYELTYYCFEVNKKYFQEALDKFANFFISPLIMESSLEREIEAVDNEFKDSLQSDSNRLQQLFSSLALPDHPLRNFPWGNSETLKDRPNERGIDVVKYLRDFYDKYYSASYMTLAVISEDSLDVLEKWVKDSFSGIPTNNKSFPSISHCQPVFDDAVFHKLYKVVPVKDSNKLSLTWLLPPTLTHYREKPVEYLSMLVGHEGYGSILSLLKKRNLATALEAGTSGEDSETNSCFSLFECTVTLTEIGIKNVFEVLSIIFQYLKLLQIEGPQKRLFDEFRLIEENDFKFDEEEDSYDFVERLCQSMQFYAPEDYITGECLYFNYEPQLLYSISNCLSPFNCFICLISKTFKDECHKTAPWFDTKYNEEVVSLDWEETWKNLSLNPELHLPHPNKFIASEFALLKDDVLQTKYPVIIKETPYYKIWYKKDYMFDLPKASICVSFVTPSEFQLAPENTVLMELFNLLFNTGIMEDGYEAIAAGYEYSLTITYTGLSLCMYGFNHKLPDLFQMLIKFMSSFEVPEGQFNTAKEQLNQSYSNLLLKSNKHSKFLRLYLLEKNHVPFTDRIEILSKLNLNHYNVFVETLRKEFFVEALVQGNITAAESVQLMEFLCSVWNFNPLTTERVKPKCLRLPSNTDINLISINNDRDSLSTVLTDYYQLSIAEPREEVLAQLIADCMNEPCFDELRTKKQLGYTVYVSDHNTHKVSGLSITVMTQATKTNDDYACQCMKDFVLTFVDDFESWSKEKFQSHVDALIDMKEEDDDCLDDEVDRNWSEILTQSYQFDRLEKHVEILQTITKTKACRWLKRYMQSGGENYRKLSVKVLSQKGHAPPSLLPTLTTEGIVSTANSTVPSTTNSTVPSTTSSTVSSTTSSTMQEYTDSIVPVNTTTLHSSPSTAMSDIEGRDSVSPSLPIEANDTQMSSSIANSAVPQVLGSLENFLQTVPGNADDKGAGSCSKDKGSTCSVCIIEKDVFHFKRGLKEYPRGPSPQNDSKK